jgi:hypothetical protein
LEVEVKNRAEWEERGERGGEEGGGKEEVLAVVSFA